MIYKRIAVLAALLILLPAAAFAQEPYTYSPDYCDFTATFPEKPSISKVCEKDDPKACYDLVSFTKVFDMASTVKIDVICNPSTPDLYNKLNADYMRTTVARMTKDIVLKTYDTNVRKEDNYIESGLVGMGKIGMDKSLFVAQLWSSPNSLMSVKAQIIGQQHDGSDALFAQILKSIGYKDEINDKTRPEKTKVEKATAPEKPATQEKEPKETTPPSKAP